MFWRKRWRIYIYAREESNPARYYLSSLTRSRQQRADKYLYWCNPSLQPSHDCPCQASSNAFLSTEIFFWTQSDPCSFNNVLHAQVYRGTASQPPPACMQIAKTTSHKSEFLPDANCNIANGKVKNIASLECLGLSTSALYIHAQESSMSYTSVR
jgi:hypothetical protein